MPLAAVAAIGAVGSVAAGAMQASAAKKAASAQERSADKAAQVQRDAITQARIDSYPWAYAGASALYQYMDEMGLQRPTDPIFPDLARGPFAYTEGQTNNALPGSGGAAANQLGPRPQPPRQPTSRDGDWEKYQRDRMLYPQQLARWEQQQQAQSGPTPTVLGSVSAPVQEEMTEARGFQETPGYQFMVEEGEKGVINNLSALGMRNSGAALKALTRYRSGVANQEYSTYLNRLASMAGMGQAQTNTTNALTQNAATNIGTAYQNAGAARASGYVGAGNAWGNAIGGVTNSIGNALGMHYARQPVGLY